MQRTIERAVRKFIADSFMYRQGVEGLKDTDSLLDQGLIDSTGVLELVFFLEKTFDIKVKDDEVLPDNLDSIKQITDYIMRKTGAAATAPATATQPVVCAA